MYLQASAALQGFQVEDGGRAGAASAGWWRRRDGQETEANRASSVTSTSMRPSARPAIFMKRSTAPATWRTGSRSVSSIPMPIAPRPPPTAANQLRLPIAATATRLLCALCCIALHHTPFAKRTCGTIRLKLLKIGALVRASVRRINPGPALSVSCSRRPGLRRQALCRCRQRGGVARLTRAAATRNPRGITPRPHRDHSSAALAAQETPAAPRGSRTQQCRAPALEQTDEFAKPADHSEIR